MGDKQTIKKKVKKLKSFNLKIPKHDSLIKESLITGEMDGKIIVRIPKAIAEAVGYKKGDKLKFEVKNRELKIIYKKKK